MGKTWTYQLDAEYSFDDPYITGLVRELQAQIKGIANARDSARAEVDIMHSEWQHLSVAHQAVTARAEAAEAQLALVDEYGEFMRWAPPGPYPFSVWLQRRGDSRA